MAQYGFLIQGTGAEESLGNFGFWDQIKTLQWVQKNIASFGGNPSKVHCDSQSTWENKVNRCNYIALN